MQTLQQRSPDLSIIIPVYNLEHYLDPMLESLAAQVLDDYLIEILFVLNNCTDASETVIRESGLDCQILSCEAQGCGPARNVGLGVALGEYVWMMDGDDWLLSKTAIRDALDKCKAERLDILRIPFASEKFRQPYFSMVWQYVIRRDFIDDIRFPNYQPSEDVEFMKTILRKAKCYDLNHLKLPSLEAPQYFYNYLREGSNMYRHHILRERI